MKAILWKLAITLCIIEGIILLPVDLVVILIGTIAFRNDTAKYINLYTNYRWLVAGWYYRLNDVSKSDLRNLLIFIG